MARHIFNFVGGEYLSTMGATWFVSYSYYTHIDNKHTNWNRVSTSQSRISVFNNSKKYHKFWLGEIIGMKDNNLNKNTIGIKASKVKEMAKLLLDSIKD